MGDGLCPGFDLLGIVGSDSSLPPSSLAAFALQNDPSLIAGLSGMVTSLLAASDQPDSTPELRAFAAHFHQAMARMNSAAQLPAAQQAQSGDGAEAPAAAPAAEAVQQDASCSAAPLRSAAAAPAAAALAAAPPTSAGLALDSSTAQALWLGQMMLTLAKSFPAVSALVSGLMAMMPQQLQPAQRPTAPAAAAAAVDAKLPVAAQAAAAPVFVSSNLGDVLAARLAGACPKGSPFDAPASCEWAAARAGSPPAAAAAAAVQAQTPTSQYGRGGAAPVSAKKEGGNPLAFLAMAASLDA